MVCEVGSGECSGGTRGSVSVIYEFGCFPMNHWMSWRMKGVDTMSVPPASYSSSLGRKNSTTHFYINNTL